MRKLLVSLYLLMIVSLGYGQVIDYWYTSDLGGNNASRFNNFAVTDQGQTVVMLEHYGSQIFLKNSKGDSVIINSTDLKATRNLLVSTNHKGLQVHAATRDTVISNYDNIGPYCLSHNDKFYFIWLRSFEEQETIFFGRKIDFKGKYGDLYPLQIIRTDAEFKIEQIRRLRLSSDCERMALTGVMIDSLNRLHIGYKRLNVNTNWKNDSFIYADTIKIQRHFVNYPIRIEDIILRLNDEFGIDQATLLHSSRSGMDDYWAAHPGGFHRSPFKNLHFGYHTKSLLVGNRYKALFISQLTENHYLKKLDTLESNFSVEASLPWKGNSVFISHWAVAPDDRFILDTQELLIPALDSSWIIRNHLRSHVLGMINSDGHARMYKMVAHVNDIALFKQNENLWLKVFHQGSYMYDGQILARDSGSLDEGYYDYLLLDDDFNIKKRVLGPSVKSYSYVNTGATPFIIGDTLYDVVLFLESAEVKTANDTLRLNGVSGHNVLHVKTLLHYPPEEKPVAGVSLIDCRTVRLIFPGTDAGHYVVLVSTDSIPTLPTDGTNYNYSLDYTRSQTLGNNTKVLYHGPDTFLKITNLIAGNKYYFSIVPGNGPAGQTLYNRDSIDTLSLFIPASSWQDSIALLPPTDTAVCETDSLQLSALGFESIKWMDGLKDEHRTLWQTDNYSFTTLAPDECLIASDTVLMKRVLKPEILYFRANSPEPYCVGDSVRIEAKSNGDYLWDNGETLPWIWVRESDYYTLTSASIDKCLIQDSIQVIFDDYPDFSFAADSFIAFDGDLNVKYTSNADSLSWYISNDTFNTLPKNIGMENVLLRVNAFSKNGCAITDSILIWALPTVAQAFPNAFSPNGDGINDVWYFLHPDSTGKLIIFDRWGAIVHKGSNRWDGKKKGEILPIGEYYYVYRVSGKNVRKGILLLMR